jgi:hypothetical protein
MMTQYINISTNEYPISLSQILSSFPNVSFPQELSVLDLSLKEFGYYPVTVELTPTYDSTTDKIIQRTVPTLIDGVWTLGWDIVPLTEEELAENLAGWRENVSVTPRQLRLALLDVDLLDEIETLIPNLSRETQIEWEYAILFERKNPQWDQLGASLTTPLTSVDIDNIFKLALTKV